MFRVMPHSWHLKQALCHILSKHLTSSTGYTVLKHLAHFLESIFFIRPLPKNPKLWLKNNWILIVNKTGFQETLYKAMLPPYLEHIYDRCTQMSHPSRNVFPIELFPWNHFKSQTIQFSWVKYFRIFWQKIPSNWRKTCFT